MRCAYCTLRLLFAFHKWPAEVGAWFFAILATCVLGAIANGTLLFSTSPTYANPVNQAFSLASLESFVLLGGWMLWSAFASSPAA